MSLKKIIKEFYYLGSRGWFEDDKDWENVFPTVKVGETIISEGLSSKVISKLEEFAYFEKIQGNPLSSSCILSIPSVPGGKILLIDQRKESPPQNVVYSWAEFSYVENTNREEIEKIEEVRKILSDAGYKRKEEI